MVESITVTKDQTFYAIYEDVSSNSQKEEIKSDPAVTEDTTTKAQTEDSKTEDSKTEDSKTEKTDLSKLVISLDKDILTYTGKDLTPAVVVKDASGMVLKAYTDYEISIPSSSKIGSYSVTVSGKGNYTGSMTLSYQIVPKNATGLKTTARDAAIKVTWKKQTKETTGYEIQYADNKDFKKARTQTIKKNKTTSAVLKKKIKKGKTYYVRIRTYKTVDVKKIYSLWSKSKKVKLTK